MNNSSSLSSSFGSSGASGYQEHQVFALPKMAPLELCDYLENDWRLHSPVMILVDSIESLSDPAVEQREDRRGRLVLPMLQEQRRAADETVTVSPAIQMASPASFYDVTDVEEALALSDWLKRQMLQSGYMPDKIEFITRCENWLSAQGMSLSAFNRNLEQMKIEFEEYLESLV